ncbi:MAG: PIG-L family deacetylase [Clostridia bacterium]|nr:PIG-L family deacetylase [Clostridia bacterium]
MRRVFPALLCAVLLALAGACRAEAAEDITVHCTLSVSSGSRYAVYMTDGRTTTRWKASNGGDTWVEIAANRDIRQIGGLYVLFNEAPPAWRAEVPDGDGWRTVYESAGGFLHDTVIPDEPVRRMRIVSSSKKEKIGVAELTVYGPGDLPDTCQHWEHTHEKADILFLATHPDDELIFFGGAIPTYAAREDCRTVVAYLVNGGAQRQHELLDGLWSMGVRNYPVISPFPDHYGKTEEATLAAMGGKHKVRAWVVALVRKYRPEVAVTHAVGGEYGHPQHRIAADAMIRAWSTATDPGYDRASYRAYGTWQMKKLYLHLWNGGELVMDWTRPIPALGGITGIDAAIRAFRFHLSQQDAGMDVIHTGARYDNTRFGLYATEVGADEAGGDFLEHIVPGQP